LLALILSSCSSSLPKLPELPKLKVYKIDIAQGNIIEASQLAQLAVGMPRRHVRVLLGTPLVQDPFHPERWDYIYNFQPGGEARQQRQVSLFFNPDGELQRLEGDVVGELRKIPLQITRTKTTIKVPALARAEDVGFWRGLRRRLPLIGDDEETPKTKPRVKPDVPDLAIAVPARPTTEELAETDADKPGLWSRMTGWLPFVGDDKPASESSPETVAMQQPTVSIQPAQTTALPPATVSLPTVVLSPATNNQQPDLQPGMTLSELNAARAPEAEEILEPEELDDRSGLFDGLLRKIGARN
jgi:outer membrane protein assembly factor BamE